MKGLHSFWRRAVCGGVSAFVILLVITAIIMISGRFDEKPKRMTASEWAKKNEQLKKEYEQRKKSVKKRPKSYSPEPTAVRINDYILQIPTWYLGYSSRNKFVSLSASWPGLISHTERNKDVPKGQRPPHRPYDSINIMLTGDHTISHKEHLVVDRVRTSLVLLAPVFDKALGLWDYRRKVDRDKPDKFISRDYRTPLSDTPLFISCHLKSGAITYGIDSIGCQVRYFIKNDIQITYDFSYKHIKDWKDIDRSVRVLVNSLFTEE